MMDKKEFENYMQEQYYNIESGMTEIDFLENCEIIFNQLPKDMTEAHKKQIAVIENEKNGILQINHKLQEEKQKLREELKKLKEDIEGRN